MFSRQKIHFARFAMVAWLGLAGNAFAHDPVFSPGPHLLYKDGVEIHAESTRSEQGDEAENEQAFTFQYGLTGDWVAGIELPYQRNRDAFGTQGGVGGITLSTKYRFWRHDTLGVQETAAVLLKVKTDPFDNSVSSGTTDSLIGLAYGYESLKWYRWASTRYRINPKQDGMQRGNRLMVDFAGGYRPKVNDYREADTVWLLELNGEFTQRSSVGGIGINDSGGSEWFVSPGIMWTLRNFAVKAGVQIPVYSNLHGDQPGSDYRVSLEFEWHL